MLLLLLLVMLQTILTLTLTYDDFCYDDGQCDPYAWGDMFPSCHPLLDTHHSPIDLGWQQVRDAQLDELQLLGFNSTSKGQWRLTNQGHSGQFTCHLKTRLWKQHQYCAVFSAAGFERVISTFSLF
ncbi:hypothetical protein AOLI_G00228170 [Acnodon oligacanthus]